MVKIWFEPHATSLDNEAQVASGWQDVDLSKRGLGQAEELADRSRDRHIAAIFCSDLQRAFKTAVPTARALALPIYIDGRLRECNYGDMNGYPSSVIEPDKKYRIDRSFTNGESYRNSVARNWSAIEDIRRQFNSATILVVGHRATQYALENHAHDKPLEQCVSEEWHWQPGWRYEVE